MNFIKGNLSEKYFKNKNFADKISCKNFANKILCKKNLANKILN